MSDRDHVSRSSCGCPNCPTQTHESVSTCEKNCEKHGPFPTAWKIWGAKEKWNFDMKRHEVIITFARYAAPYTYEGKEIRLLVNEEKASVKFLRHGRLK